MHRYDVFISYNSRDRMLVRPIAHWLKDRLGFDRVFFDEEAINYGQVFPSAIEKGLAESSSALVCFGRKGDGPWHKEEIWALLLKAIEQSHRAKDGEDFRLIPVLLEGAEPSEIPWLLKTRHWARMRQGGIESNAATFEGLLRAVQGDKGGRDDKLLEPSDNPYRGLDPFTETGDDYLYFCGRREQSTDLATRLMNERIVMVSGASGNGKSSLARAGLRTESAEAACHGIRDWPRIHFFPGHNFFHSFANAIVPTTDEIQRYERSERVNQLAARFAVPAKQYAERLLNVLCEYYSDRENHRVILIFDQFEEIFTHGPAAAQDPVKQNEWIAGLLDSIIEFHALGDPRFHIVITIRADFRVRCRISQRFWDFFNPKQGGQYLPRHLALDELDTVGLREAVKSPAERAGAYFEPGLVSSILKDVYRQRGSMPLLQHALAELWKFPSGACLSHQAYEAIGGVQSALQQTADKLLGDITNQSVENADLCRNIFLRLISLGDGVPDTRRRVNKAELRFGEPYDSILPGLLAVLSNLENRLILQDEEAIEVTHEAVIRECETVRNWIEDARSKRDLPLFRQLTEAARTWTRGGHSRHDLWRGERLAKIQRELKAIKSSSS
jgi:TIR domain